MKNFLWLALFLCIGCGVDISADKTCSLPLIQSDRYICTYKLNGLQIEHSVCKLSMDPKCTVSVDCTELDSSDMAIKTVLTNPEVEKDIFFYGDYSDNGNPEVLSCKLS